MNRDWGMKKNTITYSQTENKDENIGTIVDGYKYMLKEALTNKKSKLTKNIIINETKKNLIRYLHNKYKDMKNK